MGIKDLRSDKGSTMVLFALLLTAIMGFSAMVVDIGRAYLEKQMLQNAIDAACLAAAQDLPDTAAAVATANQYIQLNGYSPEDISITFSDSNNTIHISGTKQVDFIFAKFLGFANTTVHPSASAASGRMGSAFNYTLFSGSTTDTLNLNGSNYYIGGSTHTNYKFVMNGSDQTITGACEAVSTIKINGSNIHIQTKIPNAPYVEMPDFSEMIKSQAEAAGQAYEGNKSFNSSDIHVDSPIYVNGNVTINGSHFTGRGIILATGDITFNGSNLNNSAEDGVCFYSKNGDITINGSNAVLDGIVYAPRGTITMNGSNQTVHGRVIGNEVRINGSNTRIIGGTTELLSLPSSFVRLIQ